MANSLNGKIALITGASRGQGAAEARLFAQHGASVIVADVPDAEGSALAKESMALKAKPNTSTSTCERGDWQKAIGFAKENSAGCMCW